MNEVADEGDVLKSVFVEVAAGFFGDELSGSSDQNGDNALTANNPDYEERIVEKDALFLGAGRKQKYRVLVDTANSNLEVGTLARLLPELGAEWPQAYKRRTTGTLRGPLESPSMLH